MSSITIADSSTVSTPAETPTGVDRISIWPAVLLTCIFWVLIYLNYSLELAAVTRFVSRMITYGVALLVFLGWWLSRGKVRWRDRWLAVVLPIAVGAAILPVVDKSINWFGLFLTAFPLVMTVWTIWLLAARRVSPRTQRAGFCALVFACFAYCLLFRFDGLRAGQLPEMNWRWAPTEEQKFLAARTDTSKKVDLPAVAAKKWTLQPGDCPDFRGPNREGVLRGIKITGDWETHPPKQLWKKRVGPGWSGMIVVDGHVVTQEQRDKAEAVVCYDAATGEELWAHQDDARFQEELAGPGPRGTPTFVDGRIYALGAKGKLNCLIPETGQVVWSRDMVADAGVAAANRPQWGYSISPLVVDGLVIVFAGGESNKSILAYRVANGDIAWTAKGGKQSYSSPQLAVLNGRKQILMHDTGALRGIGIEDGAELWNYPNGSAMELPMIQPHVLGETDVVAATTPGMARIAVKKDGGKWSAEHRWESNVLRPDFSDFVIHKGCIFGLNDGVLCCLDVETGEKLWKKSRLGHGQILLVADQDAILVSNEKGELILLTVNRDGPTELSRFQAIEGKTWNSPVIVGKRVYLRNAAEMAAFEIDVQPAATQAPGSGLPTKPL
jgi:outer membrane protein assembly factor BamB